MAKKGGSSRHGTPKALLLIIIYFHLTTTLHLGLPTEPFASKNSREIRQESAKQDSRDGKDVMQPNEIYSHRPRLDRLARFVVASSIVRVDADRFDKSCRHQRESRGQE